MTYTLLTLAVLVGLLAFGIVAYRLLRPRDEDVGGFRDWVKNPDYAQGAAEYFAARQSLKMPDDIADAEIRRMVDRLFVQEDDDFNVDRLKLIGERVVPFLVDALKKPKTASKRFRKCGHALDATSPFERICDLLEPLRSAIAARPLTKYVDHKDDHFRKHAALALGNIGTSECIQPMLKALSDEDDYVRSYAMIGIQRGIKANHCSKEFLDAMFPALTKLLNREDSSVSGTAPQLLLAIDANRALPVVSSSEYFTIANREVHYIIRALNASAHTIPH